jgi:hypothetical protein
MTDERQQSWRREFEEWGYEAVRDSIRRTNGWEEPRRQLAFRWLREKEKEFEHRTGQSHKDTRRTLLVAYAALVISALSLLVSILTQF